MIPFAASLLRSSSSSSPLQAGTASPGQNGSQQGTDFGSHLDAANQPAHPAPAASAPTPDPAAPAPAKTPSASGADDTDDTGAQSSTLADKDKDPASTAAPAPDPDAVYVVAASYLIASLPVPPPPAPPTPPPAPAATDPTPTPSADANPSTLALSDPTSLSTLTLLPATSSTQASTLPPTGTAAASTPAAPDPSALPAPASAAATPPAPAPATPPANSVLQLQQLQTAAENNAAATVAAGIKLPSDGASDSSGKDENATNAAPTDAKAKKTTGNGDQTPIPSALDTLSTNLGTVNSDTSAMPVMTPIFAAPPKPEASAGFVAIPLKGSGVSIGPVAALKGGINGAANNSPTASAAPGTNADLQAGSATQAQSQAAAQPVVERVVTQVGNAQFIDVIRQSLNEQPMVTPQRISIELQTPPGETVTVFFSQSNGQLRAQLSASDSGSMQWLQQQVDTLKQSTGGPSVLWLPPQLDQQNAGQQQGSAHQQQQNQQNRPTPRSDEDAALADSLFGSIETLTNA